MKILLCSQGGHALPQEWCIQVFPMTSLMTTGRMLMVLLLVYCVCCIWMVMHLLVNHTVDETVALLMQKEFWRNFWGQ